MPYTSNQSRPPHHSYNLNTLPSDNHNRNPNQHQQESDSEYEVIKHYDQEEDSIPIHSSSASPPRYQMSNFDSSATSEKKRFAGGFDPYVRSNNGQAGSAPSVVVGEDKMQEKMSLAGKGKYANLIPVQKPPTSPVSSSKVREVGPLLHSGMILMLSDSSDTRGLGT